MGLGGCGVKSKRDWGDVSYLRLSDATQPPASLGLVADCDEHDQYRAHYGKPEAG